MHPANILIETAPTSCAKECAHIARLARHHALPDLPESHTVAEDEDFFSHRVFETDTVLVALDGSGTILGFIAFADGWVNHLYVLPDFQRLGIGARLLQKAKEAWPRLQVWSSEHNTAALRFFEKQGFVPVNRPENEEHEPDIVLRWDRRL